MFASNDPLAPSDRTVTAQPRKSRAARYLFAVTASLLALFAASVFLEVSEEPSHAPLIGAIALIAWYGGVGPALVGCALSWGSGIWLLTTPRGSFGLENADEITRWAISLVVALMIVFVAGILRVGRQRATGAAVVAESSLARVESLQQLAGAMAGAVSTSDISRALADRASALLGAQGATVGLLESDDVLVVEPIGLAARLHVPGRRIGLDQATLLTKAVRDEDVVRADDRGSLEEAFPDSAEMLPPIVQSAIALPMRFDDEVAGVVEFLFDRPNAVGDEQVAVALTATGLAQLALQRALLYERAQESRAALDRILRVAPQFHAETADEVTAAICREARTTFGADYGVLWRLRGDMLELVRSDPLRDEWPRGLQVPLAEFPGLATAVRTLGVSFVSDVLAEAQAEGLERVRSLGIRSSLRSSIVIGGRTELVLVVSWQTVVSEPDPSTVAIVRRFADQAGLAFEHLERRRAEAEAARRAEDTQRVQEVTAALANALTSQDVAEVLADGLREGFDADAVSVSAVVEERYVLKTLAWHGYSDDLAQPEISLDADTPTVGALKRTNSRKYTAGDVESEFSTTDALHDVGHASYFAVPLVAGRERIGVLIMSWHDAAAPDTADRALIETVAGHAALALDRARVFESERTIAETLQRSVLPASLPRVSGVQLAARYLPGTQGVQVGGDWFDAIELPDGRLGLIVGDVMGKGVHAAASMGQLRNALRAFSVERLKPSSALARLDRLGDETFDSAFATVVYAVVDTGKGLCRYSSAGHPPPLIVYPDGRIELLEDGRGLPLGTGMRPQYRQAVVELPAGSVLILYSDGLVERRGRSIDDGLAELVDAVRQASTDPERVLEKVIEQMVGEAPRGDDIALLAARFLPVAPQALDLRVRNTIDGLYLVRDAVRTWLEGTPLDRSQAESLVLAIWEASANAIEHAADSDGKSIGLHATLDGTLVRAVVEDDGRWSPPTDRAGRGFGLQLMRSLASSVEIVPGRNGRGTRVTIEYETAPAHDTATEAR